MSDNQRENLCDLGLGSDQKKCFKYLKELIIPLLELIFFVLLIYGSMSQNLAIPVCDVVPHFFNERHVFILSLLSFLKRNVQRQHSIKD